MVPEQPPFPAQGKITYVPRDSILEFKALPEYHEPDWVTEKFVKTGKLPPVAERLPKEPMVFKTGNMPDGVGVYGDTMRHVIGGRPEGWNYSRRPDAGLGRHRHRHVRMPDAHRAALPGRGRGCRAAAQSGQELGMVRRRPQALTMQLIEGAKWSDGDPFDADDVMFYWDDNVVDPNVSPLNGATPETFGEGTTLKAIDKYTIEWTFKEAFPRQHLYAMAYGTFCPGPSHILKTKHPKYAGTTYDQYKNGFPPEYMNMPVMGAWVPVAYRSGRHHRAPPQPLLLEGRRSGQSAALSQRAALQALDLGRPRRAGDRRFRRLLEPRAAGKLRRIAEARRAGNRTGPACLRRRA